MSNLKFLIFALVLFFVHLLFYQYLSFGETYPDLFLILVVFAGLYKGPEAGSAAGFFCGLAQDSFSYAFFGLHALTKTIIGFLIGKIRHSFYSNNFLVQGVIIIAAKMLHDIIYYAVFFSQVPGSYLHQILLRTPLSAVYTAVLGLGILFLINFRIRISSR
ncbi:MAG: rod shape-determining protein MreD [Candidatus Glassbacteria bacterium]|nr:rod shape-determining protein MreD [Candidatus Glassbacteria bacterium]